MKVRAWQLVLCGTLCACGATEGPLLVRRAQDAGSTRQTLQYQITGALDLDAEADVFVVDLFSASASQVAQLHAAGAQVMAYVSAGSLESWRDDASSVPASAVGATLADYPDERWLDTRSDAVRTLLEARFDRAVSKGFDGVYASTVGAYRVNSGFPLTSDTELDFLTFLVDQAHARQLQFGLSGDFALAQPLSIDFAIASDCVARKTCAELTPWVARKLPCFDLEVAGDQAAVCEEAQSYGIEVVFKHANYDAYRSVCP